MCAYADGAHHAAVVVEHANGAAVTRCVSFTADSISGQQALVMSGIEYATYPFGGSLGEGVCQVDNEPATPPGGFTRDNCLGNPYWGVWASRRGGSWATAARGVSNTSFSDGDAEGLRYGDGSAPPPSPAGICPTPPPTAGTPTPSTAPSAPLGPGSSSRSPPDRYRVPARSPAASGAGTSPPAPGPTTGSSTASTPSARARAQVTTSVSPPLRQTAGGAGVGLGWAFAGVAGGSLVLLLIGQVVSGRGRM